MVKGFYLIILMLVSLSASAWESGVSTQYAIGDSESRMMASENAYKALKIEAAGEAKSYIQGTETLEDGKLSESIEVLSASMVEISNVEKNFRLDSNNNQIMDISGVAHVDESVLKDRIEQIQSDQSKQQAIKRLDQKNTELKERLSRLQNERSQSIAENLNEQAEAYREIEELSNSVSDVFSRGTLLSMAQESGSQLENVKGEFKDEIFREMVNTDASAEVTRVKQEGRYYNAEVIIDYEPDFSNINDLMSEHLATDERGSRSGSNSIEHIKISGSQNSKSDGPKQYSEDLYDWLKDQSIVLNVSVGDEKRSFYIGYSHQTFMGSCASNNDNVMNPTTTRRSNYCLMRIKPEDTHRVPGVHDEDNHQQPFIFKLSEEQASKADHVKAEVVFNEN